VARTAKTDFIKSYTDYFGWTEEMRVTRSVFMNQMIQKHIADIVHAVRKRAAEAAAAYKTITLE
jgi:hypothetical protein